MDENQNPFQRVLFTPLDLPPIPDKEFILQQFREEDSYVWWYEDNLTGPKDYSQALGSAPAQWSSRAKQRYPGLLKYLEEKLPFEELYYVRLARARENVKPHVDENYLEAPFAHHLRATAEFIEHQLTNEPIGYRFQIAGCRDNLYLCRDYDPTYRSEPMQEKFFCKLPQETDFFLIHNSKIPHGVDLRPGDELRLVGFVLGRIHRERHLELIRRSVSRFSDYTIFKDILWP